MALHIMYITHMDRHGAQKSSLTGLVVVSQDGDGHCPGEGSPQEVQTSSGYKDLSWIGYEQAY